MSEKNISKRAVWVGVFIIVGLLFLVGAVLTIGNLHSTFQRKINVSTVFTDVNGLTAGNNIWFSGVKIGTVKKLEFVGGNKVRVIMNINTESQQYIRSNAKVKLSTDGLIGNKILVIYGGTSDAPAIRDGDILANEVGLSTEEMMATLQKSNVNIAMLTEKLANGEGTIGKLLQDEELYDNINATAVQLRTASANAQQITAAVSQYSANLNKEGNLAHDLVTDTVVFNKLKTSVTQLQQSADNAAAMVSSLRTAAENPNSPLGVMIRDEASGAKLKQTIENLEKSSGTLNTDLEALQHSIFLRRGIKKEEKEKAKAQEQVQPGD